MHVVYKMRNLKIRTAAVCVVFLIKLRWPKSKSLYESFFSSYRLFCSYLDVDFKNDLLSNRMMLSSENLAIKYIFRIAVVWPIKTKT